MLMDIRIPELDGLEATRRILAADNDARILILTTFDLDEYIYEALKAGASGFVLKDDPPEQLIEARDQKDSLVPTPHAAARTQRAQLTRTGRSGWSSVGRCSHVRWGVDLEGPGVASRGRR